MREKSMRDTPCNFNSRYPDWRAGDEIFVLYSKQENWEQLYSFVRTASIATAWLVSYFHQFVDGWSLNAPDLPQWSSTVIILLNTWITERTISEKILRWSTFSDSIQWDCDSRSNSSKINVICNYECEQEVQKSPVERRENVLAESGAFKHSTQYNEAPQARKNRVF